MSWEDEFDQKFKFSFNVGVLPYTTKSDIKNFIKSLLKKQRDNCAENFEKCEDGFFGPDYDCENLNCILNAPEPE